MLEVVLRKVRTKFKRIARVHQCCCHVGMRSPAIVVQ